MSDECLGFQAKLYHAVLGSKRVLAANFGQIPSNRKHESDGDDSDDGDSVYLSAKEDSDSTGFLSAIGSRSNLRFNGRLVLIPANASRSVGIASKRVEGWLLRVPGLLVPFSSPNFIQFFQTPTVMLLRRDISVNLRMTPSR